jgi:hypothetical protein
MESLSRGQAPQELPSQQAVLRQRSYVGLALRGLGGTESNCLAGPAVGAMLRAA